MQDIFAANQSIEQMQDSSLLEAEPCAQMPASSKKHKFRAISFQLKQQFAHSRIEMDFAKMSPVVIEKTVECFLFPFRIDEFRNHIHFGRSKCVKPIFPCR